MSSQAQRYISKKAKIQRDRIRDFLADVELPEQHEERVFVIAGDIWDAACCVFPSLLCPDTDEGAYQDKQTGIYYTYTSERLVAKDGAPSPWICFGPGGSANAAREVIAYMQLHNLKGEIEFLDGKIQDVHDYELPEWARKGTWYYLQSRHLGYNDREKLEKEQQRSLYDAWYEAACHELRQEKERALENYEYIGSNYYLSKNSQDYLFYTEEMIVATLSCNITQEDCNRKWREFGEQVRANNPYASIFAKAFRAIE